MFFSLAMVAGVFVASCSQILLKTSANRQHKNRSSEYLNVRVIAAYTMFAVATVAGMFVIRYIPLSLVSVLESSSYIFVLVLSRFILKERITGRQLAGMLLILTGVLIFTV